MNWYAYICVRVFQEERTPGMNNVLFWLSIDKQLQTQINKQSWILHRCIHLLCNNSVDDGDRDGRGRTDKRSENNKPVIVRSLVLFFTWWDRWFCLTRGSLQIRCKPSSTEPNTKKQTKATVKNSMSGSRDREQQSIKLVSVYEGDWCVPLLF